MAESGGLSGRGQDTAASSAQAGHNGSPGLGTISWTAPLAWLEQVLPSSPMLADLRRSLPIVAFQQEKGNPLTPKPRATASILPGSDGSLCMQQKDPALPQDQCTSTPISVASAGVWASPVSCQDSGPKMPLEQGPDPLEQVGPITSPFLAAPGCPEADATASPEGQDSPALCLDPGTAHVSPVSCRCHSLWGSPLSLLDDGLNVSLAGKAPSWQGAKGVSANPSCLACAQVCTPLSSLPAVSQQDQGTSITPLSVASVAAWTSQLSLREAGVNTSPAEKATTDSTAETDSLLWHCSRDQLSHLSRAELEGRLESTLIIMEALSRQIRAGQELWRPAAQLGPAEQRDAATQTPASESREEEQVYCDLYVELRQRFWSLQQSQKSRQKLAQRLESASEEMRAWSSESRRLQAMVEASFLRLQEDRQSLCQQQKQAGSLLSQCRAQLQRWGQKHGEMARGLEAALKAKDAANLVQESVQARAAAQIRTLELSAESRRSLWALLQEAKRLKADLCSGYTKHVEDGDRLAAALQADWAQMRLDYEGCRSTIAKCLTVARRMEKEVEAARCEGARHQEVCQKLEERTVEVVNALGRVNELVETNVRLSRDLQAALQKAMASECQLEQLQEEQLALARQLEEKAAAVQELREKVAWLTQEKERAEQERDSAQRDFREASDCREFIEQENQVARRQLSETEGELKASLSTLRERSTQLEDLRDAHQKLRQEQELLGSELAGARAELQGTATSLGSLARAVLEVGALQAQFLEAADLLQTALPGEAAQVAPRNSACTPGRRTPHRLGTSLVDSVLKAASQESTRTPGLWSETTAFTQAAPAAPPQPSEIKASLAAHTQDLQQIAEQLRLLARRRQEEVRELRAQILQLEQQLETSQRQHRAEMDSCNAARAKLSKAFHLRIQNEKELQELLRQQEEKQDQLSDQRREVGTLQEEVAQLRLALQKSETTATTLWEELSGTRLPDVQEKIWLRQEVGKLKELLLQKDAEHTEALARHVVQVRCLEDRLRQAQQLLRHQEKAEVGLKEALSVLPAEVSGLAEVQHLLDLLD